MKNIISSTPNGFKLNAYIFDDLEDLKRRYTSEQLLKIWKDAYPKLLEINSKPIIGTSK